MFDYGLEVDFLLHGPDALPRQGFLAPSSRQAGSLVGDTGASDSSFWSPSFGKETGIPQGMNNIASLFLSARIKPGYVKGIFAKGNLVRIAALSTCLHCFG